MRPSGRVAAKVALCNRHKVARWRSEAGSLYRGRYVLPLPVASPMLPMVLVRLDVVRVSVMAVVVLMRGLCRAGEEREREQRRNNETDHKFPLDLICGETERGGARLERPHICDVGTDP